MRPAPPPPSHIRPAPPERDVESDRGEDGKVGVTTRPHTRPALPHSGARRNGQGGPREQPADATTVIRGLRPPRPPALPYPNGQGGRREGWRHHAAPCPPGAPTPGDVGTGRGGHGNSRRKPLSSEEESDTRAPRPPISVRRPPRGTSNRTGGKTGSWRHHAAPYPPDAPKGGRRNGQGGPREQPADTTPLHCAPDY